MEKKTFKEFVKEHRALIGCIVGLTVGAGAVLIVAGDKIKNGDRLEKVFLKDKESAEVFRTFLLQLIDSNAMYSVTCKPKDGFNLYSAGELVNIEVENDANLDEATLNNIVTGAIVFMKK